ncbi:MAG: hypothetical protein ACI8TP_004587 [Acidimicrobiales bacterium]|jgi:hypothetical protein
MSTELDVDGLVAAVRSDRNRAVDFYKAVAMVAVAFGRWMAIAVFKDEQGSLVAKNALEFDYSLAWITWALQVMPLFFLAGGFSSAVSLDSHNRKNGTPQDWVASRLRRMMLPTMVLAYFWIAALTVGSAVGVGDMAFLGAAAAAIPLWFLANYTIDTAIAPVTLPMFRRNPLLFFIGIGAVFTAFEILGWLGVPLIHGINWVIGWLIFQVLGFAWKDGLLPSRRQLAWIAPGMWALTYAVVKLGPWRASMVNDGEATFNPTHPPSIALMLFGMAYCATAVLLAQSINSWLAKSVASFKAVAILGGVGMSVYLWHFSAAVVAGVVLLFADGLPTAEVGTFDWWIQKTPLIGLSFVTLLLLLKFVKRFEVAGLLADKAPYQGSMSQMLLSAALLSGGVKLWTGGSPTKIALGLALTTLVWHLDLKANPLLRRHSAGKQPVVNTEA